MSEIAINNSYIKRPRECCSYCGAALSPAFYFCVVCAMPYKPVEAITGRVAYQPVESEQIHQKAPHVWPVFWSYAVLIFIVSIFRSLLADHSNAQIYTLIFGSVLFFALTTCLTVIFRRSLVVQLKQIGVFHKAAVLSFCLLPLLLILNYFYHFVFISSFIEVQGIKTVFEDANIGVLAQCILIGILPAITEEIAFRGLIQHWLQTAILPWRAIILSSALFAALHVSVISAPYLFLLGLLLGWTKWKTGSLYPSMLLHFLHNAIVVFLFPYFVI